MTTNLTARIATLERELAAAEEEITFLKNSLVTDQSIVNTYRHQLASARADAVMSRPITRRLAEVAGGAPRTPRPDVAYGNSFGCDDGESYHEWRERHERGEPSRPLWEEEL